MLRVVPFAFWREKRNEMFPTVIGASITGQQDLYRPSNQDKGLAIGSICFSAIATDAPGFVKETHREYGQVWRRISAAEIEQRRTTTLWK